jgi:hypothetical protein
MNYLYMREKPTNIQIIGIFVGFSRIYLLGILIFKGLTARRLYTSFGVKGLICKQTFFKFILSMFHYLCNTICYDYFHHTFHTLYSYVRMSYKQTFVQIMQTSLCQLSFNP